MTTAALNYPTAVSYAAAFVQAAADPRWTDEERAALRAVARDDRNGGRIHGSGRVFAADGLSFAARYADRGINLERHG